MLELKPTENERFIMTVFFFKWQQGEPTDSLMSAAAAPCGLCLMVRCMVASLKVPGCNIGLGNFIHKISEVCQSVI